MIRLTERLERGNDGRHGPEPENLQGSVELRLGGAGGGCGVLDFEGLRVKPRPITLVFCPQAPTANHGRNSYSEHRRCQSAAVTSRQMEHPDSLRH